MLSNYGFQVGDLVVYAYKADYIKPYEDLVVGDKGIISGVLTQGGKILMVRFGHSQDEYVMDEEELEKIE